MCDWVWMTKKMVLLEMAPEESKEVAAISKLAAVMSEKSWRGTKR